LKRTHTSRIGLFTWVSPLPWLRHQDECHHRRKSSRSAAFRRLLAVGLEQEALSGLARAEARAYARAPASKNEMAAFRALARSQRRVMQDLARGEKVPDTIR
jgi:hypothetical protein